MIDSKNWDELATQAQQGDKSAYSSLLRSIAPYIKSVISPGLANPHWVDDIVQDVLMSVHKSLVRYMPDQPFKPWLNAIIRYRRADFLSQYYKQQEDINVSLDDAEGVEEGSEDPIAGLHDLQAVEAALSQLPPQQQTVFKLLRIDGFSVKEVAKQTGISESAVKVTAHRCSQKIKEFLMKQQE